MTMNTWPILGAGPEGSPAAAGGCDPNACSASQQPTHARRQFVGGISMMSRYSVPTPVARHNFEFQPVAQLGQLQPLILHRRSQAVLPCEPAVPRILRQLPQLGDKLIQLGTVAEQPLFQQRI